MENVSVLKAQEFLRSNNGRIFLMVFLILALMSAAFSLTWWLTAPKVSEVTTQPVSKPTTAPPPAPPGTAVEEKDADTFEIYQSKDPFEPLLATQTQQPGAPASPGTPISTPGAAPAPPLAGPVGKTQITLMDIYTENNVKFASIQVGSTLYKAKEGETFATNYKLVSAGTDSATILYGDDSATLKIGETIFK